MNELGPGFEPTIEETELERKPKLRELLKRYMAGDSHEHTVFSNPIDETKHEADYTFEQVFEYVKSEMKKGETAMEFVVFVEHPSWAGNPHLVDGRALLEHHRQIHEFMAAQESGPQLISGVETSIISADGKVDVLDDVLAQMDMVIASKHDLEKAFPPHGNPSPEQLTNVYLALMDNPHIDVIGHPNRNVHDDEGVPNTPLKQMDWNALLIKAKETNTALEINVNAPMPPWLIKKVVESGVQIFIGTDAHTLKEYQKLPNEIKILADKELKELSTEDQKLYEEDLRNKRINQPLGFQFGFWRKMARILKTLNEANADPKQVITSSSDQLNKWLASEKKDRKMI